jgi:hypothetical protein
MPAQPCSDSAGFESIVIRADPVLSAAIGCVLPILWQIAGDARHAWLTLDHAIR